MIVVGVDGSEGSAGALRWALGEARTRSSPLTALYAWSRPAVNGWGYIPPELLDPEGLERRAQARLDGMVAEIAGTPADVEIDTVVREGRAAAVLTEASKDAEMLVVGSRGHGGFASTLLGSVGHACVQHASCPVVVVPGTLDAAA